MPSHPGIEDPRKAAEALLSEASGLSTELHPHRRAIRTTLDSRLDRDLGLDSLARLELLTRLERKLGIRQDEQELFRAETLHDVFAAILRAGGAERQPHVDPGVIPLEGVAPGAAPSEAQTLIDVLEWHARSHPARPHLYLIDEDGEAVTYSDLLQGAREISGGLGERGLVRGSPVALMLPTCRDYFYSFFGILLAGGVPVPIYPPFRPAQIEDHLVRQAGILGNAGTAW